MIVPLFDNPK
jgi:hypothetical protein